MKPKILYIVHQWIDPYNKTRTSIGGTTLHLLDIINNIKNDIDCYVLYPSVDKYMLTIYSGKSEKILLTDRKVNDRGFTTYDEKYKKMLNNIIKDYSIDLVHIHHLMGHHYDILNVLKSNKMPTIMTLHDYFLMCPRVNFLYKNEEYCNVDTSLCDKCLDGSINTKERKKIVGEILDYSKINIVPNITVADNYKKVFTRCSYTVIEHGIDLVKVSKNKKEHSGINIAFVGIMTHLKGSKVAKEMINTMDKKKYKFYMFGVADDVYFHQNKSNYAYYGEYDRSEIGKLLVKKNIDVACLLTVGPESYCYTLSEVLNANVPVIGFDIGAIGNRITSNKCGWTVPLSKGAKGVIEKIEYITNNQDEYLKVLNTVKNYTINNTENMVIETNNLYNNILKDIEIKKSSNKIKGYYKEIKIPKKRKSKIFLKKIYHFIRRHIPYFVKRPIYLIITGIKKGLRRR